MPNLPISGLPVGSTLDGKIIVSDEKLTIYQAWQLALDIVDTPYVMNLNLDESHA